MWEYIKNFTKWIFIWMVCNANCGFCNAKFPIVWYWNSYFSFKKYKDIISLLDKYKKNGVECIVYEGWDFSIHPRIFDILDYGKKLWIKQTFQTNWIKLEDIEFVKKLKKSEMI